MTVLDFRPGGGATPLAHRVRSHAGIEARLLLRNGEQLVLTLVIPVGLLLAGRLLGGPFDDLRTLAPSVLALAVWSTAFTSLAIATGFERRYGVLERLAATPLGKPGLLAGKAAAVTAILLGQLLVLGTVAVAAGWRPRVTIASALLGALDCILAAATFAALALLLAGRLRAEVTLGLANVVYVLLLAGGALVLPVSRYPAVLQGPLSLLPTAALGEGLRAAATGVALWWPLGVLAVWLAAASLAAWKGFRWTS